MVCSKAGLLGGPRRNAAWTVKDEMLWFELKRNAAQKK